MKAHARLPLFAAAVIALCQPAFLWSEEPAAAKVVWQRNLYAGFQQAIAEKKPLVVLFTMSAEDDCGWCKKLEDEVIDSTEFRAFAGDAVFVRAVSTDEDDKGNYAQLKSDLEIKKYPITVVLDVNAERIVESGRIVGFHERDKFIGHFNTLFQAWHDRQATVVPK